MCYPVLREHLSELVVQVTRRREQNRKSQRASRERKTKMYNQLLERFKKLEKKYEALEKEFAVECSANAELKSGLEALLNTFQGRKTGENERPC